MSVRRSRKRPRNERSPIRSDSGDENIEEISRAEKLRRFQRYQEQINTAHNEHPPYGEFIHELASAKEPVKAGHIKPEEFVSNRLLAANVRTAPKLLKKMARIEAELQAIKSGEYSKVHAVVKGVPPLVPDEHERYAASVKEQVEQLNKVLNEMVEGYLRRSLKELRKQVYANSATAEFEALKEVLEEDAQIEFVGQLEMARMVYKRRQQEVKAKAALKPKRRKEVMDIDAMNEEQLRSAQTKGQKLKGETTSIVGLKNQRFTTRCFIDTNPRCLSTPPLTTV